LWKDQYCNSLTGLVNGLVPACSKSEIATRQDMMPADSSMGAARLIECACDLPKRSMREAYGDGSPRVKCKCKFVFIRFDDQRGHDRTRDDDFTGTKPLAKCASHPRHGRTMSTLPCVGLRITGARGLAATSHDGHVRPSDALPVAPALWIKDDVTR